MTGPVPDAIDIGRDLNGIVVKGNYNTFHITVERGSSKVSDYHGPQPTPVRRAEIRLLPRAPGRTLLGRDKEMAELRSAMATGRPVQLFGPPGIGKSTLLQHGARRLGPGPDGVVYLSARDRDVSEIAQEIFRACYDASAYVPSAVELQQYLQHLRLRIYLDDLSCSPTDLQQLMHVVQSSALVFTAQQRIPAASVVHTVPIGGLDESAAINLLAGFLSRSLRDGERAMAAALSALDSSPMGLQRVAAAARHRLPEHKDLPNLLPTLIKQQPPESRDVLHLIASVGGGDITADHLDAVLRRSDSGVVCHTLVRAGLLTATDAGYRLPEDVMEVVERIRPLPYPADVLCRHFTAWSEDPATSPAQVADHHRVVETLIVRAEQEGHADLGVALARAAAPRLQASLRFGAWGTLLGAGRAAAEKIGDKLSKAYFLHEEGIRCLLTHKLTPAALLLTEAAVLWQELGVLSQVHAARESAQLAASQSITASGTHTGIHAAGVHASSGHAVAGGTHTVAGGSAHVHAHAHVTGAAANGHAHTAGLAVQGGHGAVAHAGGAAVAPGATAAGHGAAAAGQTSAVGTAHMPSALVNPGHLTPVTGHAAPVLPTPHTPLTPVPAHPAHLTKPTFQMPGSQTPASHSAAGHGPAAHGHAVAGGHGAHGSAAAGHTTVGAHAGAAHGSALAGHGAQVGGHAAAGHGVTAGTAAGTTTGSAATGSAATTGLATMKAAAVGLTLCAAVGGGVALVRANQPSPPPQPPATHQTTVVDVDPICGSALSALVANKQAIESAFDRLGSAVDAYNTSVENGTHGDWDSVQSNGNTLVGQLNQVQSKVSALRSRASDPRLVSALADMGSSIPVWTQDVRAFVGGSTDSYELSPSDYNDAVQRIDQACN